MPDPSTHEILIIEHDGDLGRRIEAVLNGAGHRTHCKTASLEGLAMLEEKDEEPFSLVISSFRMPVMDGDQILERAKLASPLTQRMIITDPGEVETVMGAVNKAEVHACLSIPFTDVDLLAQVNLCLDAHAMEMKRANLIRVTERQNRQMYRLAKLFKERDNSFASQIKSKTKQLRVEQSRGASGSGRSHPPMTLGEFLELTAGPFSPVTFVEAFQGLSSELLALVNTACAEEGIELEAMTYESARSAAALSESKEPMDRVFSLLYSVVGARGGLNPVEVKPVFTTPLDDYMDFTISEDRLTAFARLKKKYNDIVTIPGVKDALGALGVTFGIKQDALIKTWLSLATPEGKPFVIAQGTAPVPPVDAGVNYHFKTDFLQAGKVRPDGSIDFRERGDIPFTTKSSLLAEKTSPIGGSPGVDLSGTPIQVADPVDIIFNAGQGARLSEDGLRIYADCDGQPHLDAMGNVTVLSELTIKGDVDFETGNINFKGNVIVGGVIKEGFSVRGANLTAGQIEGADIELTGDLNVGGGIIDAKLIKVQGSVQAKYVNNSFVRAFGDLIVQKEIIDSTVFLSGACENLSGNIISSTIVARKGVKAFNIGTETSQSTHIRVGVDDHIQMLLAEVNKTMDKNLDQVEQLKQEIVGFEVEDQGLNVKISDAAHIQDRAQVELGKIEGQMAAIKDSKDFQAFDRLSNMVKKLHVAARRAEEGLDRAFHLQDVLVEKIRKKKHQIALIEDQNRSLIDEKKAMTAFLEKAEALPRVIVAQKARPETFIEGPNTQIRLKNIISKSRIVEVRRDGDDGVLFFEMVVSNL
ncbi:conserved hypothetical protein [Desulforapulum autotrophicum HRM2]|uniref:Response regulatory domain-containing protein n=1 Tax=Desulforapulum autotrophicum (strain ATCC 43914 / DSM 3382 / VKM B-1955 / HRM2) TaxID=177437 RepID=C0QAN5_DESAH|nr:FapA family protein [Desulforapulum autotrophicum]ACN16818.1 conserved hypothetical protein [Desulforapulum autotrophicum HRM2]